MKMDLNMKVRNHMEKDRGMEYFNIHKEEDMKEVGITMNCTDKVCYMDRTKR